MFYVKDLSKSTLGATADTNTYTDSVDLKRYETSTDMSLYYSSLTTTTITITQQCSLDNVNWYAPVSVYNVSQGVIAAVANGTAHARFVTFTPVVSPYIRFNIVATATAGSVQVQLSFLET